MTFHMTDAERHLARQFGLHPQEARALDALREAVDYCPDESISDNAAVVVNVVSRLRRKLRGHGINIVRVRSLDGSGYRLEAEPAAVEEFTSKRLAKFMLEDVA